MSLKNLEAQKIEGLVIEKKQDSNNAIISVFKETCELSIHQNIFTFRMKVVDITYIDTTIITKLSKCLKIISGGLLLVHNNLIILDDVLYSTIKLENDEISNIKIHERIINYFGITHCLKEVFKVNI